MCPDPNQPPAKLVVRTPAADDPRERVLAPTPTGTKAFADLSADIATLLGRISDRDQQRVVSAMATIATVLGHRAAAP